MLLEERRAMLARELLDDVKMIVSPDYFPLRDQNGKALEGSVLELVERQMQKKTEELKTIDALLASREYRLWRCVHEGKSLVTMLCVMCVLSAPFAFFFHAAFGVLCLLIALLSLRITIWAASPPSRFTC